MTVKSYLMFLLPIVFVTFRPTICRSQDQCTITLSGTVKDENQEGLPEATIVLSPSKKSTITDSQGYFQLTGICPDKYQIEIRFIGYKTIRRKQFLQQSITQHFSMEMDKTLLEELLIKGEKKPVAGSYSYTQISDKQLEHIRSKSLGKLLAEGATGVNTIQTGPAIFKPVIHGVHSQRILILNNGLRLAGQRWGVEHAPEVDPFSAASITVIKDAGAIKYGAGSLGGVIVITPDKLPEKGGIKGKLHLTGESNGLSGLAAGSLEGGFGKVKGLGWRLQGKVKKSGDFSTPNYILSNTGFEEYDYRASIGFHNKKVGVEATYSSFNTQLGILRGAVTGSIENLVTAMESSPPLYTGEFTYTINNPRQEVSHNVVNLNAHYEGKGVQYRLQYGLQINKRQEFDIRRGGLNNLPVIHLKMATHSIDMEVDYSKKQAHSWCTGISGSFQNNLNIPGTQRIPFIPNYTHYSLGVYNIEYFRFKKMLLEIGLRYDYKWYDVAGRDFSNELFKAQFNFHSISGTAGLVYSITESSTFTTNLGTAWRPPAMAELYSLGTHQSVAAIEYGLLLNEETTQVIDAHQNDINIEQAIKWVSTFQHKKGKLAYEISGYANYILNYTYLKPRGVTRTIRGIYPYFKYTQTNASFFGLDVAGTYTISPSLTLNAKASWLRATDEETGGYLVFIPTNRFELGARYERKVFGKTSLFFTDIKTKYVMQQYRAPTTLSVREISNAYERGVDIVKNVSTNIDFLPSPDGYFLAEVSAGIEIPIHNTTLSVALTAENLLNTTYREYTNRMRYYADEPGRNITCTVQYQF